MEIYNTLINIYIPYEIQIKVQSGVECKLYARTHAYIGTCVGELSLECGFIYLFFLKIRNVYAY